MTTIRRLGWSTMLLVLSACGIEAPPRPGSPSDSDTSPPSVVASPLRPSSLLTVTMAHTESGGTWRLATVRSDGTGYAKVTGFGQLTFREPKLVGLVNSALDSYDEPRLRSGIGGSSFVKLPQGRGSVYLYHDVTAGRQGILWARRDGTTTSLYSTAVTSQNGLGLELTVSPSGRYLAAVRTGHGPVLMRIDGKTFPSGKSWVELTISPAPRGIDSKTLTLTDSKLFVVAHQATSAGTVRNALYRGPTDGSSAMTELSFPAGGTSGGPAFVSAMARSADAGAVAFCAGASGGTCDIHAVSDSGTLSNLSNSPAAYLGIGKSWGQRDTHINYLAVSSSGTRAAYVQKIGVQKRLFVAPISGTGSPVELSGSPRFHSSNVEGYFGLHWVDDSRLVFGVHGPGPGGGEVFVYDAVADKLRNLTGHNCGTTRPFCSTWSGGELVPTAMWISPDGTHLFMALQTSRRPSLAELRAVDLRTYASTTLLKNVKELVGYASMSIRRVVACEGTSTALFSAIPAGSSDYIPQLFLLDMAQLTTPRQLTSQTFPGKASSRDYGFHITQLELSPNCKRAAIRRDWTQMGKGPFAMEHTVAFPIYTVGLGAKTLVRKMSRAAFNNSNFHARFSPLSEQLVFVAGGPMTVYAARSNMRRSQSPVSVYTPPLDPTFGRDARLINVH